MSEPTKEELLTASAGGIDTDALAFTGRRGERARHLSRAALEAGFAALPEAPRDRGTVDLLVARGASGDRHVPPEAFLTRDGGMPGDRWADDDRYGTDYQLATCRTDFARLVANGQPLDLHGDNVYLSLDISDGNLPPGSRLRLGEALTEVTPQAHNGCKKWVQRFGLEAMQFNLAPAFKESHLRGIYLRVLEDGLVRTGDAVIVVSRG